MAFKVSTAVHKGKAARDKNSARKRIKNLPRTKTEEDGLSSAIVLSSLTIYKDDTVENVFFPAVSNKVVIEEIFSGVVIDSNYRIMFTSNEVSRYESAIPVLLSAYVSINAARYKISRDSDVTAHVPLFVRVDTNGNEFVAVLNPLFGLSVHDDKLVLTRRDKKQSRYSVRLENYLRKYKTGRVNVKLPILVRELNASETYGKNYGQFKAKVLREAVDTINYNDNGVQITDFGRMSDEKNIIVWFDIVVSKKEGS